MNSVDVQRYVSPDRRDATPQGSLLLLCLQKCTVSKLATGPAPPAAAMRAVGPWHCAHTQTERLSLASLRPRGRGKDLSGQTTIIVD